MPETDTIDLSDTNLALIGSTEDLEKRKAVAMTDPQWTGAGAKPGLEVWRVENEWDGNVPQWGVKRWDSPGVFHIGDSYIVLKTARKSDDSPALIWDIHYWIGGESTQDEYGVAAAKTVELDDFLDGFAIQHREIHKNESDTFKSCFPKLTYKEGGFPSGFKKPAALPDFENIMYKISKDGKMFVQTPVDVDISSLEHTYAFVLDLNRHVYVWCGDIVSPFVRHEAHRVQREIVSKRGAHICKAKADPDDNFWAAVGGSPGLVKISKEAGEKVSLERGTSEEPLLWRLTDASGNIELKKEKKGKLSIDDFDTNDVFFVDGGDVLVGWGGTGASPTERRCAILLLQKVAEKVGHFSLQCASLKEGQESRVPVFQRLVQC